MNASIYAASVGFAAFKFHVTEQPNALTLSDFPIFINDNLREKSITSKWPYRDG